MAAFVPHRAVSGELGFFSCHAPLNLVKFGQIWPTVRRCWSNLGRCWPNSVPTFARRRPDLAKFRPQFGRVFPNWPNSAQLWICSANFDKTWPTLAQLCKTWAPSSANLVNFGPMFRPGWPSARTFTSDLGTLVRTGQAVLPKESNNVPGVAEVSPEAVQTRASLDLLDL